MSHLITYKSYPCKVSEKGILRDLNHWAFDPRETTRYHGHMRFYKDKVFKTAAEAETWLQTNCKRAYDDAAVRYKDGRKIFWLCKIEYHC